MFKKSNIDYYNNGQIKSIVYLLVNTENENEEKVKQQQFIHTDDDNTPAVIEYYENGSVEREMYLQNGFLHTNDNDKPAVIEYYPLNDESKNNEGKIDKGNIKHISYWKNNMLHRDGGLPAYIEYYYNGNLKHQSYWINDEVQNIDENKPAIIEYSPVSQLKHEYYVKK